MTSFIDINGFQCRYEFNKNSTAKDTVIFINGIANPLESWNQIKRPLESKCQTLAYDLRGQWFSELANNKPYSFLTMAEDLYLLTEKLGIENAHVVGTSLGGEVALWFALLYPQKVNSLTTVASVSEIDNLMCLMVDRWNNVAKEAVSALEKSNNCPHVAQEYADKFYEIFIPDIYSNAYLTDNLGSINQRKIVARNLLKKSVYQGHIKLSEMFYKLKKEEKLTDRLHEIKCPTLVVGAELDIIKPVRFSALIAEKIPNAHFHVLQDTGHAVLVEKPLELVALIDQIIGSSKLNKPIYSYDHINYTKKKSLN